MKNNKRVSIVVILLSAILMMTLVSVGNVYAESAYASNDQQTESTDVDKTQLSEQYEFSDGASGIKVIIPATSLPEGVQAENLRFLVESRGEEKTESRIVSRWNIRLLNTSANEDVQLTENAVLVFPSQNMECNVLETTSTSVIRDTAEMSYGCSFEQRDGAYYTTINTFGDYRLSTFKRLKYSSAHYLWQGGSMYRPTTMKAYLIVDGRVFKETTVNTRGNDWGNYWSDPTGDIPADGVHKTADFGDYQIELVADNGLFEIETIYPADGQWGVPAIQFKESHADSITELTVYFTSVTPAIPNEDVTVRLLCSVDEGETWEPFRDIDKSVKALSLQRRFNSYLGKIEWTDLPLTNEQGEIVIYKPEVVGIPDGVQYVEPYDGGKTLKLLYWDENLNDYYGRFDLPEFDILDVKIAVEGQSELLDPSEAEIPANTDYKYIIGIKEDKIEEIKQHYDLWECYNNPIRVSFYMESGWKGTYLGTTYNGEAVTLPEDTIIGVDRQAQPQSIVLKLEFAKSDLGQLPKYEIHMHSPKYDQVLDGELTNSLITAELPYWDSGAKAQAWRDTKALQLRLRFDSPAILQIPLEKKILGSIPKNRQDIFAFVITGEENAPLPEETEVKISGEGSAAFGIIEFKEEGTYRYTIAEQKDKTLPYEYDDAKEIVVSVVADEQKKLSATYAVDGEDMTNQPVVFTNTYKKPEDSDNPSKNEESKKTSIKVTKLWEDGNNKQGKRPESIVIQLKANGDIIDEVELNEMNQWAGIFKNLPKYDDEEEIIYTIEEVKVDGYSVNITGDTQKGFVVINTIEQSEKPRDDDSSDEPENPRDDSSDDSDSSQDDQSNESDNPQDADQADKPRDDHRESKRQPAKTSEGAVVRSPKTSDESNLSLWIAILIFSMVVWGMLMEQRKRSK